MLRTQHAGHRTYNQRTENREREKGIRYPRSRFGIAMLPPSSASGTTHRLMLPNSSALSLNPSSTRRVPLKVAILVPIPPLQQRQQRVAERRVHPNGLAGEV